MFPKQFLSPHFWSIQQRFQFSTDMLQTRLYSQLPVLRFMQNRLEQVRSDDVSFVRMRHVLGRLGAGQHPTVDEVLALKAMLSRPPYSLESLPQNVLVRQTNALGWVTRSRVLIYKPLLIFVCSSTCAACTASTAACGSGHGSRFTHTSSITWTWLFGARATSTICRWTRWCARATYAA